MLHMALLWQLWLGLHPGSGNMHPKPPVRAATFENVERWLRELRDHADGNIVIMLVCLTSAQPLAVAKSML